jgi:hypothetical protein
MDVVEDIRKNGLFNYRESILKNATKKLIFSQNASFKVRLQEKE